MSLNNHSEAHHQLLPTGGMNSSNGSRSSRSSTQENLESRIGLLVSSFSSLLSFAHSDGVQLPTGDSSRKLSTLVSRFSESPSSHTGGGGGGSNISSGTCSLPSLRLRSQNSFSTRFQDASLQDVMAVNLSSQVVADRSTIDMVPKMLLQNTASSFEELISSRLRVSMQAITRTTLKLGGEGNDARVLRKLLTTAKPVKVTTVVTSYQLVHTETPQGLNDGAIVRPLVFETIVDLSIFGKMYTISLEAPGTISATLNNVDNLLDNVKIMFDTMSLLKAMMTQARAIVKKTIKRAASITTTVSTYQQMKKSRNNNNTAAAATNSTTQNEMQNDFTSASSSLGASFPHQQQQQQQHQPSHTMSTQDELLASYPEHLRETVSHFLPEAEIAEDLNVEGFPPNLLQTLKSLTGGDESSQENNDHDLQLPSNNNELHQGLFSWMNNDDIMLSQAKDCNMSGHCDNYQAPPLPSCNTKKGGSLQETNGQTLLKKSKKVSFCIPDRN